MESQHDLPRPPAKPFGEIIRRRYSRREVLQGLTGMALSGLAIDRTSGSDRQGTEPVAALNSPANEIGFSSLEHTYPSVAADRERCLVAEVAPDHQMQVLFSWGDPVVRGARPMDILNPSPEAQENCFGYNNDFVGYVSLPRGSQSSRHGLLCVNHEYTNPELMFPAEEEDSEERAQRIRTEMAAHGHSIVEIRCDESEAGLAWRRVEGSRLNRRISALSTDFVISGPAAGDPRMQTADDPSGRLVRGTLNNCAGGITPWGTILFAEENIQGYFHYTGEVGDEHANHQRMGLSDAPYFPWHRLEERFDADLHPHEPNRFGWVVEVDPYDPEFTPIKRTSLGRNRHEGAATSISSDGRVVVYLGDDQRFEFLYKFVTTHRYDANDPVGNRDLLDEGTLYAARFSEDGMVTWLPLVHGENGLDDTNGFASQADVLIETRRAATLLGATPMDRPEDVEENPQNGRVYVMLTNNTRREDDQLTAANPRPENRHGHILELVIPETESGYNHAATHHEWNVFLLGGNPSEQTATDSRGHYGGQETPNWLSCPDNCSFDNRGRLWIATDGGPSAAGFSDGVYACWTDGPSRSLPHLFFQAPVGAEVCGPCFTPDNTTFFVAVQHPAEGSTFAEPSTRWPHPPESELPPLPSVIAITHVAAKPIAPLEE